MHTHQRSSDPVATIGLDIGKRMPGKTGAACRSTSSWRSRRTSRRCAVKGREELTSYRFVHKSA